MHMAGNLLQRIKQVFCGKPKAATCWCQCEAKSSHVSDDELRKIVKEKKLNHIAIIPDGDRRWARENGLQPSEGHRKSFLEVVPKLCQDLFNLGVHTVMIWGASPETWKRDKEEMDNLLKYFDMFIKKVLPIVHNYKVKIIYLGKMDRIPSFLKDTIYDACNQTAKYSDHVLNIGIDYGGQDEILRACKKLLDKGFTADEITKEKFEECLDTASQPFPYPDLVIRASGEHRISGFMAWQIPFTEFYFPKTYIPDFDHSVLRDAIVDFGSRKRRYGGE
jgi:undecaprenyl diphosphate synthase